MFGEHIVFIESEMDYCYRELGRLTTELDFTVSRDKEFITGLDVSVENKEILNKINMCKNRLASYTKILNHFKTLEGSNQLSFSVNDVSEDAVKLVNLTRCRYKNPEKHRPVNIVIKGKAIGLKEETWRNALCEFLEWFYYDLELRPQLLKACNIIKGSTNNINVVQQSNSDTMTTSDDVIIHENTLILGSIVVKLNIGAIHTLKLIEDIADYMGLDGCVEVIMDKRVHRKSKKVLHSVKEDGAVEKQNQLRLI